MCKFFMRKHMEIGYCNVNRTCNHICHGDHEFYHVYPLDTCKKITLHMLHLVIFPAVWMMVMPYQIPSLSYMPLHVHSRFVHIYTMLHRLLIQVCTLDLFLGHSFFYQHRANKKQQETDKERKTIVNKQKPFVNRIPHVKV